MITILVLAYVLAAAAFAGHALYSGVVLEHGRHPLTPVDTLLVSTTALLAGALWIVFIPVLLTHALRAATRRSRPVAVAELRVG